VTSQEPPQSPSPIDVWQPHQPVPLASARRWPRRLLLLVLLGLTAAGTGIGVEQRMVAAQWRERAETLEQQRDDAIGRSEALAAQLSELGTLVQLSAEDLANLEERLAELANEKARAEDRVALTREELRTLAERVASASRLLNGCVDDLLALQQQTISAFNRLAGGASVDVTPLNERLEEVRGTCTVARQAGADAVALASRLR
jgi:DNA repair exonuclease SbcCD ATPase subunit